MGMLIGFALLLNWVIQLTRSTFWVTLLLMKKKVFLSFYKWANKFSNKSCLMEPFEFDIILFSRFFSHSPKTQKINSSLISIIRFAYGPRKSLYCAQMHIYDNSVGTSCVTITQNNPFASQSRCDRLSHKGLVDFPFHKNPFSVDGYYIL